MSIKRFLALIFHWRYENFSTLHTVMTFFTAFNALLTLFFKNSHNLTLQRVTFLEKIFASRRELCRNFVHLCLEGVFLSSRLTVYVIFLHNINKKK